MSYVSTWVTTFSWPEHFHLFVLPVAKFETRSTPLAWTADNGVFPPAATSLPVNDNRA